MFYGNDEEIGNALAPLFRHDTLERKNVMITTKIPPIYMGEEDVEWSVLDTLEKLQIQYVDLLLIHTPFGMKNMGDRNFIPTDADGNRLLVDHDYVKTWKVMEKLVRCGKVRQIGLSNFSIPQVEEIMKKGTITPANLQHECHAYLQQNALREFCRRHRIVPTGYAPLGAPARPQHCHEEGHLTLLEDPLVNEIAWKLGKTPGQILIRYVAQLGVIPLPKSVNPKRIIENYEAMFFDIPDKDFKALQALDQNMKYYTFDWAKSHPRFPVGDY